MKELTSESKVGSKGELFPNKEIRERLGLKPNTKVIYRVKHGTLIVEPIPNLMDLLDEPPIIETTLEEHQKERREHSKKAET
ncbi:MAG: AbrB/MazE/SpoVT family DNA-binding domain-containing protein [Candidatus Bathyarchaeota archaeon]|nr:AbrB/MazE/SpoVT family DNA-binding domain-containing protein [Candidatus Bathyarchaeota archaeon]